MEDYTIFYKEVLFDKDSNDSCGDYDLLISAYNGSDRVIEPFHLVNAKEKHWLVLPQYDEEAPASSPNIEVFTSDIIDEVEYFKEYLNKFPLHNDKRICVDISGFLRPHLIFFVKLLKIRKFKNIDFIYSEPVYYSKHEKTQFSKLPNEIKQVPGFCNRNYPPSNNDILIFGAGYDDMLIAKVASDKKHCKKFQIIGFPSLQIDMYQESMLRLENAKEDLGDNVINFFAPANDPFVTAQTLKEIVDKYNWSNMDYNIYLCPVSTKAQVLGFTLFFLNEEMDNLSIIFPYSEKYSSKTSEGRDRTWLYTVEF